MVRLPIRTVSALNVREHWGARAKRVKAEREAAYLLVKSHPVPCVVRLTRGSWKRMDDDNLRGALKGIRDGIADRLGVDDGDPRVRWEYAQAKARRGEHWVEVEISHE